MRLLAGFPCDLVDAATGRCLRQKDGVTGGRGYWPDSCEQRKRSKQARWRVTPFVALGRVLGARLGGISHVVLQRLWGIVRVVRLRSTR